MLRRVQIKLGSVFASIFRTKKKVNACVISFPKSGRTWVRFFLTTYVSKQYKLPFHLDLLSNPLLPKKVPSVGFFHFNNTALTGDDFSSFIHKKITGLPKDIKIVWLYRDPRDVVVSYYFQLTKREKVDDVKQESLSEFLRDERLGLPRIITYMNAVQSALVLRDDVLYVTYEACKADTESTFRTILQIVGQGNIDEQCFSEALAESSFANMKRVETDNAVAGNRLSPGDKNDPESYKVRKGKVGGYTEYFSESDLTYAAQQLALLDSFFNYE